MITILFKIKTMTNKSCEGNYEGSSELTADIAVSIGTLVNYHFKFTNYSWSLC